MPFKPNNCRLDLEDREMLNSLPKAPMDTEAWKAFQRPAEVGIDWHRTENQGHIGSCQGESLSSLLERLAFVRGEKVQLSAIFAYLATQKLDGLLGSDSGSTISGGAKVGLTTGVPPESATGYPSSYPNRAVISQILSANNYALADSYKANSLWQPPMDFGQTLDFIGGGGGLTFGIRYYWEFIPKDRVVRDYTPNQHNVVGGHAMCILGYTKTGELWAINSHADGPYRIVEMAWKKILQDRQTASIGLMGNPTASPVNWLEDSPWLK